MVVPGSENCMLCLKVIENVICFDLMCRVGGHGCGSKLYRTLRPSLFKTARDDITCSQISCIIPLPPDVQGPLHSSGPLIQLHTTPRTSTLHKAAGEGPIRDTRDTPQRLHESSLSCVSPCSPADHTHTNTLTHTHTH